MQNLPSYVSIVFILTTLLTLFFLYRAVRSKIITGIILAWLIVQAIIGLSGFYTLTTTVPPRFLFLIGPPLLVIAGLFIFSAGRKLIRGFDSKWLTYLHSIRVPVEIVLLWLFLHKQVPQLMTFEGRNFDILSGLTAPLVAYFGYQKLKLSKTMLLLWNFICLGLLINIVVNAILSSPFGFQQFAFEQPNVAILYFPFVWLPAFLVPAVLLSHLVSIRQLLLNRNYPVLTPSITHGM